MSEVWPLAPPLASSTASGLYEYCVMLYGLSYTPLMLIDDVLRDFLDKFVIANIKGIHNHTRTVA